LRCLADVIQFCSSQFKDQYFEQYWSFFIQKNFQEDLESLLKREQQRLEHQISVFKIKNNKINRTESNEIAMHDNDSNQMHVDEGDSNTKENETEKTIDQESKQEKQHEKSEEEKEQDAINAQIKLILLETIGKCWPLNSEIQGKLFFSIKLKTLKSNLFL
jgi:predicted lipase